jgi:hypothetical protein
VVDAAIANGELLYAHAGDPEPLDSCARSVGRRIDA